MGYTFIDSHDDRDNDHIMNDDDFNIFTCDKNDN